jgi:hypothetical protein
MEQVLLWVLNRIPNWVPEPFVRPIGVAYLKRVQRRISKEQ